MRPIYELGPFRLDPEGGVLTHAGQPQALGARAVAVLAALVREPNTYVQKNSIIDAAWPGVVVEESNLAVQIAAIRRVLARAPGGERWIETLARRGYRFVGPVAVAGAASMAAAPVAPRNTNLPEALTSFVGREQELEQIQRLLGETRLLTLVGVGGIGKTRLALEAATRSDAFRDGVWLVDLAPLADPALVPSAVAQALGVREVAGVALIETLCAQVAGRQLLLLDNCEHLAAACAHLADALLRNAAELTILATSREPLHVAGEQILRLPALSLPSLESADGEADVARTEAVQLFVERARKQHPDFALTPARLPVIAQLCIRLDGIPLALELAAARLRSMSIEQINDRLDDRFRLLTGGARAALPRQQTLRATLDWSHDLLAESERAVLRRLAVFAGGFTLEAAAAIVSDQGPDDFAVIDLLSQLVARSLVVADTNVADARYRLLETMRAYALEKLSGAGETQTVQRRHAQYYRTRFQSAPDDALRMSDAAWRAIYPVELDNVRTALDWAMGERGDEAIAVALAGPTSPMWVELSLFDEGAQRLGAALALVGEDTPAVDQARLWKGLGALWSDGRALDKAADAERRAADFYRRIDDPLGLSRALVSLSASLCYMGRLDEAASVLAETPPLLERAGAPRAWGHYSRTQASLSMRTGDPAAARTHLTRALACYESAGAVRDALAIRANLADMIWAHGDLDAALAAAIDALAHWRIAPHARKSSIGNCLMIVAGIRTERGELSEALAAAREGMPLLREAGLVWYVADHLALCAALSGHGGTAAMLAGFSDAAHAARKVSRQPNEMRAHARLQELLRGEFTADRLERLRADGAAISESEACRLVESMGSG